MSYNVIHVDLHPSRRGCYWAVRARRVDGYHNRDTLLARGYSDHHLHLEQPGDVAELLAAVIVELRTRFGLPAEAGAASPSGEHRGAVEPDPGDIGTI